MRILLVGDTHTDRNQLKSITAKKEKFECDKVFILGDMGWWPNDKGGQKFISEIVDLPYPIYFLDGNHEDHDNLDQYLDSPDFDDEGFIDIHPNIKWAFRGHSWNWDGVDFMSLGGAYSIDRRRRTKFISWFPRELISDEDVKKCIYGGPANVDIMLTHDAPSCADLPQAFMEQGKQDFFWYEEATEINQAKIQQVCNRYGPKELYHGHYHIRYTQHVRGLPYDHKFIKDTYDMKITGLNCNQTSDYFTVIDTKDRKEQWKS